MRARIASAVLLLMVLAVWPANPFDLSSVRLSIQRGASARAVEAVLKENRILPRVTVFRLVIRMLGLQDRLRAGDYAFSPSDSLPKVILKLISGETVPPPEITVTFPEGSSVYKMGSILRAGGYEFANGFQGLVNEGITPPLRERHRKIFRYIPSESLEGYLYPDTYRVFADTSVEVIAENMVNRFEEVVLPFWERAKKDSKMTLHEVLTLASIIEKEASTSSERPIISSVYHNRLKMGMPLAADPTIKYALERPTKKVYLDQLSVRSPYNTYKRKGLPPGPICNPGIESIRAAVYPVKTEYYYFVAKRDGSHIFSKTWQEHQKARQRVSTPTL